LNGAKLADSRILDSRILIVDDQAANLKSLETVLAIAGYGNLRCLNDSREVLRVFGEFSPDLLLLDLHMPHLDGLAVMDRLSSVIPPGDYLPILVLTGDATSEAKQKALSHGAHDFLSKPLNSTEVQLRVRNLLQTRCLHLQIKAQNTSLEEANRQLRGTQAHLIQSEKMASLGQLVTGIAHEINNPLAFVINNIFLIQQALDRLVTVVPECILPEALPLVDKLRIRINGAREGGDRVKDLVAKLRMFSRLDEGRFLSVNIHESIESVLLLLRHKTDDRIRIERHYGDVDTLSCRASELNQVFMNILCNAIDAIEGSGTITLTTGQCEGTFSISIRDTGKGIPEAIRNRVFEPFFTTKADGDGVGLGLAVSYGIMKAHNGSIELSSKEGEGTEFILRIPITQKTEIAEKPGRAVGGQ